MDIQSILDAYCEIHGDNGTKIRTTRWRQTGEMSALSIFSEREERFP